MAVLRPAFRAAVFGDEAGEVEAGELEVGEALMAVFVSTVLGVSTTIEVGRSAGGTNSKFVVMERSMGGVREAGHDATGLTAVEAEFPPTLPEEEGELLDFVEVTDLVTVVASCFVVSSHCLKSAFLEFVD